jgi:hypothetical protein
MTIDGDLTEYRRPQSVDAATNAPSASQRRRVDVVGGGCEMRRKMPPGEIPYVIVDPIRRASVAIFDATSTSSTMARLHAGEAKRNAIRERGLIVVVVGGDPIVNVAVLRAAAYIVAIVVVERSVVY